MLSRTPSFLFKSALPRPTSSFSRSLSTRPHPLASKVTPRGPVPAGRTPPKPRPNPQLSALNAVLLATLVGSTTYILGRREGLGGAEDKAVKVYREPTQKGFEAALEEIKAFLPEDGYAQDRDSLVAHGWNDWGTVFPHLLAPEVC